jgi:hypothetical protein
MGRNKRQPLEGAVVQQIIKNILDGWSISLAIRYATGKYNSCFQKWILRTYPKVQEVYKIKRTIDAKTAKMSPANAQLNNQIMTENMRRVRIGLEPLPLIEGYLNNGKR